MANFTGTSGNDFFEGDGTNQSISGLAGDDTLIGGGGNDSIQGGAGNDRIDPGQGVDTVDGGSDSDDRVFLEGVLGLYTVTAVDANHTRLVSAITGVDVTLSDVERVQFGDVMKTVIELRVQDPNDAPVFAASPPGVFISGQTAAFDSG
ncbi:MAG TPA: hypothetical protein VK981_03200, partial [Ramlibacter sp.]|nr:hypothetical protein [Ramlibacter sp.]